MQLALGLGLNLAGVTAYLDIVSDSRKANVGDEEKTTSYTNIVADISYDAGFVAPFFKFATFSIKQPDEDAKENTAYQGSASYPGVTYDDNGQAMTLGVNLPGVSANFTPYLAYVMRSGKFKKPEDAEKSETLSSTTLVVGFGGTL